MWAVSGADPLNIIPQLMQTSSSSHPVMHDRSSALPQPSLRTYMLNLDGRTPGTADGRADLLHRLPQQRRQSRIRWNRANGPHGSQYLHLLERRYEFSQVAPLPSGVPELRSRTFFQRRFLIPRRMGLIRCAPSATIWPCSCPTRVSASTRATSTMMDFRARPATPRTAWAATSAVSRASAW